MACRHCGKTRKEHSLFRKRCPAILGFSKTFRFEENENQPRPKFKHGDIVRSVLKPSPDMQVIRFEYGVDEYTYRVWYWLRDECSYDKFPESFLISAKGVENGA